MKTQILRLPLIMIYVISAGAISWFSNARSLMGIDDANIYFVYMKNLANGHGLVFNIGGEKVEGFTSLLWTLIGSAAFKLSSNPQLVLILLNLFLISYALWRLIEYMDNLINPGKLFTTSSILVLGVLFVVPGYFDWTIMSIMETGLWSSLLILISLNVLTTDFALGKTRFVEFNILIVLMIVTRPESMLWCLFFILMKFLKLLLQDTPGMGKFFRLIVPAVLTYLIALVGLTAWRLSYFGFPVPNTFYAKVSSNWFQNIVDGVIYLMKAFVINPVLILTVAFTPLLMFHVYKRYRHIPFDIIFGLGILLVTLLIPLYTGGDHFSYSRFIQPTIPVILFHLMILLHYSEINLKYSWILSFLVFISFVPERTIYANIAKQNSSLTHEWGIALLGKKHSELLNIFFRSASVFPSQGVATAGARAYFYHGFTNDLLGLNNTAMAHRSTLESTVLKNHSSFNKEVFYEQQPNLFWYAGEIIQNEKAADFNTLVIHDFYKEIFKDIHEDAEFNEQYSAVLISQRDLEYSLAIFASNNFLESLREMSGYEYKIINYQ